MGTGLKNEQKFKKILKSKKEEEYWVWYSLGHPSLLMCTL